jgi:uncharacterized protein YbjT (DUF2867 family)
MSTKILVIGATGMLGEPVAHQLKSHGFDVRVLTRSPEKARARFGLQFEIAAGDVEDPAALAQALTGCQGVHINLHGLSDPDLERRGAEQVSRLAAKTGIERITYISGASVCEENCWYPGTKARFEAEKVLQASGVPYTIFRCHYFMETLHNFAKDGLLVHIGKHPHPYHWVASADFARMVAKAYATPEAANKILYVCGSQALTMRQAVETFDRIVYPERRVVNLPIWMARWIAYAGKRAELQDALPFFEYCARVKIILSGSPEEANRLLGAPETTVEAWSRQQIANPN